MPLSFRACMQVIDFMWPTGVIGSPLCGAHALTDHLAYSPQPVRVPTRFLQNDINALKCFGCMAASKTKWHWAKACATKFSVTKFS